MRKRALAMMMVAGISLMAPSCWCYWFPELCAPPPAGCPVVELVAPEGHPSQDSDRIRDLTQLWHKCCPDEANSWCAYDEPRNPDCTGNTPVYSRFDTGFSSYTIPVNFHAYFPAGCPADQYLWGVELRVNKAQIDRNGNWTNNTSEYYIEDTAGYMPPGIRDYQGTLYFNIWYQKGNFTDSDDFPNPDRPWIQPFNAVAERIDFVVAARNNYFNWFTTQPQTKVMGPINSYYIDQNHWGGRREDMGGAGHFGASRGSSPHEGIDIAINESIYNNGSGFIPALAVSHSQVERVDYQPSYGCLVDMETDQSFIFVNESTEDLEEEDLVIRYAHLKLILSNNRYTDSWRCIEGERSEFGIRGGVNVRPGQWIGYVDRTGNITQSMRTHLHFEIVDRDGTHQMDPEMFFGPFTWFHRCDRYTNTGANCCTCSVVNDPQNRCGW